MSRRFALIVNPAAAAGRAPAAVAPACAALRARGADCRVVDARSLDHAVGEARAAVGAGEVAVAVGGDGLVGPIAGALAGGPGTLGILPAGRGNDFARTLGIPFEPPDAARVLVEGEARMLDVAHANGKPFVGIASLGFDSDANRIANESRMVRGSLVYVYAALRALAGWRHARFEVSVDGAAEAFSGYSVAIANARYYGGGMLMAPQADPADGRLDVISVAARPKLRFLKGLPKVFKGEHLAEPGVSVTAGCVVSVSADRPFVVYADGDPIARLPLEVTVAQRALRLIAPA